MKRLTNIGLVLLICLFSLAARGQELRGYVVDAQTGDSVPHANITYKARKVHKEANADGSFAIQRINGETLTITAMGYKPRTIKVSAKTTDILQVRLISDTKKIDEVVVRSKRKSKYSRKNNPAVELMRRVIAAKKRTDLTNHDFYQYDKYQKITLAINGLTPEELEGRLFRNSPWLLNHVELCPANQKLILPLSVDETYLQHIYRKQPRSEKDIIKGQSTKGISTMIQTGEALNTMVKDIFTDINIYDDHIRFLNKQFPSPIGETAVSFYRFYIQDTVYVGNDHCIHLQFLPVNQQDFGFRGELYVLNDSTLHVKRCNMQLPGNTGVNFVQSMKMEQEFTKIDNGEWVLTTDNVVAELEVTDLFQRGIVLRNTSMSNYAFDPIAAKLFKGSGDVRYEPNAKLRDEDFWQQHRTGTLTQSESNMGGFVKSLAKSKNFKWVMFFSKALIENFIETGSDSVPSKVDLGPVNTFISHNFVDGFRLRFGARTTAKLNPHLFAEGFYAYGTRSKQHYYQGKLTYSFVKPEYQPVEFPSRYISFESTKDVMSPADKFTVHNKDNAFMAFKVQDVRQMYFLNRQQLTFKWETDGGFATNFNFKTESNRPAGDLIFQRINGDYVKKIRTTEVMLGFDYRPGQTFVNSKQNRIEVNHNAPHFALSHTMGMKGVFGADYNYHYTEATIYKRFWMGSWGKINLNLKGGIQWSKVPFPLLIMPPVNLSYFDHENTFSLMNNMEFLSDRYAFWCLSWDMNGKIFNRIPLLHKLKWREYFAVRGMWSTLTKKNTPTYFNPQQPENTLFYFPDNTYTMNSKTPYWEVVVGVHNIFKVFEIDYVRRLTYLKHPGVKKWGIRFGFNITF